MKIQINVDGTALNRSVKTLCAAALIAVPVFVFAGSVPPFTDFQNGQIIDAGALNAKFNALRDAVNDNDGRVAIRAITVATADSVDSNAPDGTAVEATDKRTDFDKSSADSALRITVCDTFALTTSGPGPEGRVTVSLEGINGNSFQQTFVGGEATIQQVTAGRATRTLVFNVPANVQDAGGNPLVAGRYRARVFVALFSGSSFSMGDRVFNGTFEGTVTVEEHLP